LDELIETHLLIDAVWARRQGKKKSDPVPCELIRCPLANIVGRLQIADCRLQNSALQSPILAFLKFSLHPGEP
jgi:hypothetical protein